MRNVALVFLGLVLSGCFTINTKKSLLDDAEKTPVRTQVSAITGCWFDASLSNPRLILRATLEDGRRVDFDDGVMLTADVQPLPSSPQPTLLVENVEENNVVFDKTLVRRVGERGILGEPSPATRDEVVKSVIVRVSNVNGVVDASVYLPTTNASTEGVHLSSSKTDLVAKVESPGSASTGSVVAFAVLVPFTVALDIATFPLQVIGGLLAFFLIRSLFREIFGR